VGGEWKRRNVLAGGHNPVASLMAFVMAAVIVAVAVDDDVDWRFAGACMDMSPSPAPSS